MTIDPENRPLITAVLLAAVLLVAFGGITLLPGVFEPLSFQATDHLFELRAAIPSLRPTYDDTVVMIDVDDPSLKEIGSFYLERGDHARLVRNLTRAGVTAQAHDVIFAAPQPGDAELVEATADGRTVYYGMAVGIAEGSPATPEAEPAVAAILERERFRPQLHGNGASIYAASRHFITYPEIAAAARGLGFLDIRADLDGVYRRAPLVVRDGDGFLPSFPLRVASDYLQVTPDRIEVAPGQAITLRGARRPGEERAADLVIPIDRRGCMVVNYVGPWETMKHYAAGGVWAASDDRFAMLDLREEIGGKIAILTWMTSGGGDIGPVPTDPLYPLAGIHANVIHTILTRNFLRQLSPLGTLWVVALPFLVLLWVASLALRTIPFLAVALGSLLLYVVLATAVFLYANLIVDLPGPILVLAGGTLVVTAYHYHLESKRRAVMRSTLDAYFPPRVVDKIVRSSRDLIMAAQKKEVTVLFSDIKGFTSLTATMEAAHVRKLLNEYFERMVEIVFRHDGTLDKFMGDGLMVFFGDPEAQSDHALRCAKAAIEMQGAARELDRIWAARGDMRLEIRIGINTGEAIVGNMGSERRLSYTALGRSVNLAQRLESSAPVGGILISARTNDLLAGAIPTRWREPIRVKGIDEPIAVYEVQL